jgi:hypothetical protein
MKHIQLFEDFVDKFLNEAVDYKYLVDLIINSDSKYNLYYNPSHNVVNLGGTGYDKGSLVSQFKAKPGESDKIKANFYYASKDPGETKTQVEKISKGKIEVSVEGELVIYKIK